MDSINNKAVNDSNPDFFFDGAFNRNIKSLWIGNW